MSRIIAALVTAACLVTLSGMTSPADAAAKSPSLDSSLKGGTGSGCC